MKRSLIAIFMLLPLLGWAQPKSTAPLSPAESKARLQQLGDSLRKYDYFENFDRFGWSVVGICSNKNAKNRFPDRYGIINDYGQLILPCEYSDIRFQEHSDLMMVMKDEKAGFMNRQLEWVIPLKYNFEFWAEMECADFFDYGMIVAADADWNYGVVDSTGREILPCRYKWVNILGPDFFVVNDDHCGAINRNGDTVIPFVYQSLHPLYASDGRYFTVMNQNKYGVISNTGQEILPIVYEEVLDCDRGFFSVSQNGKWGVVDSLGRIVIPLKYKTQHIWFRPGMDLVEIGDGSYLSNGMDRDLEKCKLLNMKGKVLLNGYDASVSDISGERLAILYYDQGEDEDARCEIIDRNGKKVDGFDSFDEFVFDGIDMVNGTTMIPVKRNGKWGFVNRDFQLIVPCIYDAPAEGWVGYGSVNTGDGLITLIDEQGQQLVSGPYRFISSPTVNGWFKAGGYPPDSWNGITGFIDRYGNTTFTEEELRQIEEWHNETLRSRR